MLDHSFFKRSRVRLVRQTEIAECGLACLAMIANFHGLKVDLGTLRRRFSPSVRGATLKSIMGIADQIGLTPRALRVPLEQLEHLGLPAILHWDINHFVVVESVSSDGARIHNPDGRSRWIDWPTLSKHYSGVALEVQPSSDFRDGDQQVRLKLQQLWHRMVGMRRALLQILVLSFVVQAFVLAAPYYMQIAIDSALPASDVQLLAVLGLGFGLFTLIYGIAFWLRGFVSLTAGTTLGVALASNVARRLFRLPIAWFERRHIGDILSRFQSILPIQTIFTEGAVTVVVDGLLAVLTLAVMLYYSVLLAMIALVALAFYGLLRLYTFSSLREAQDAAIVTRGLEQTHMIESLRGIAALRLTNRETLRHASWQTRLTDSTNSSIDLARIAIWQNSAALLLLSLENVAAVYVSIRFVIAGGFSLGMVFAYLAYKTQFLEKARSLVDQSILIRMLGLHLERLSDIALADEDVSFGASASAWTQLSGGLELRNVTYRYSPGDPLVLDQVNLVIRPGEHIAITGPSGGGKSTLVKIMLGLVEPDAGEVLVDGLPLERFGHKSYHDQIAAVLQEDSLFIGSIADNIALFEIPDMARIADAARAAAIHDDIIAMPMGYETFVGNMGSTLSGGQRQRTLLARALYRAPRILLMDEGTAHLDLTHERQVNEQIDRMGITRIIIAHRKETISAADRVVVVDRGRVLDPTAPTTQAI